MYASVFTALLNIVLNYYCISKWGFIAAGYTTLFCYMLQAILDYFAQRKITSSNVYNMRLLSALSLVVVTVSLFSNILYAQKLSFIRYLVLFIILTSLLLFKKQILKPFKKMKGVKTNESIDS